MSNLYEIIEKLCEAEGITITEMCRRANVPRGNLSDLLNNRQKSLSPKNLKKIADYFNVTIDYLLTGIKKAPAGETDKDEEIYSVYEQLTVENKAALLAAAKAFLQGQE